MKTYLFIYSQFNAGGAERALLRILQNLDPARARATLLITNSGGTLHHLLMQPCLNIELLPSPWHGYPPAYRLALLLATRLGWRGPLRRKLRQAVQGRHFDVAISFLEGMPLKCHALLTDIATRNYSWVHCDLLRHHYTAPLFRRGEEEAAYRAMDGVVCVSRGAAGSLGELFPSCAGKTTVIYTPIDCLRIAKMARAAQVSTPGFTVCVCGRLTAAKRTDRAIRLARRAKDEGLEIYVMIVGGGELMAGLQQMARELEVADRVSFAGHQENPYPYLLAADLLLSPSSTEGFGLAVCEAMALGIPVVSTRTAGTAEILAGNRYSLLCEQSDDSLYRAVKAMYSDASLRRHYSTAARRRAQDFSAPQAMAKIYAL